MGLLDFYNLFLKTAKQRSRKEHICLSLCLKNITSVQGLPPSESYRPPIRCSTNSMNNLYSLRLNVFAFLIIISQALAAQQDLSLPHLWHLGQQNSINPASSQDSTYYINIPDLATTFQYSEPNLSDIVRKEGNDQVADINRAIQLLHPTDNEVTISFSAQTYRLMYNTPKWSIQQFQKTRFQGDMQYPKALAQLGWQGNASFIGQSLDIAPSFEVFSYQEAGIGGSYQLGKWRVGATLKLLAGIGVAKSQRASATLRTDEDIYQLELETDYEVVAADYDNSDSFVNFGLVNLDFADISLLSFRLPDINFDVSKALLNARGARNRGIAFDFGAVYELNDQWRFGLSVLDIGRIKWKDNAYQYTSKETTSFDGVNLGRIDFASSEEIFSFDNLKDTLEQVVQFTKTPTTFKTSLAAQTYFSTQYQYNSQWNFGLALYGRFGKNDTWGSSIAANYQWQRFLNIGLLYALEENDWDNLGLNVTLRIGPFQLYGMTNNLITLFQPRQLSNQTARVGMALIF